MAWPVCRRHPHGRVRRDGYYGKHREFVRWECVPGDGEPAHYLRRDQLSDLRVKLVGGLHGSCDECERRWGPTDGLVSAHYDNFVLRAKAQALVSIAQGSLSLRGAAHEVRVAAIERRRGRRPAACSVSRDGRLARDWVPQYTDIVAEHYLPTHWPRLITVDSFDVRVKTFDAQGNPVQKGKDLYSVLAAVGYGPSNHRGQLWHVAAFAGESEREFREFFRQLEGQPEIVVCDGSWAIRNAAAWAFPNAEVYPCAWHLYNRLKEHGRRAGLYNNRRRIYQVLREDMFWYPARWDHFERVFARSRHADLSRLDEKTIEGIEGIVKWRRRNRDAINRLLPRTHWPRDLKHLEERLDTIQSCLGDRRRAFRNLHRLNCVLTLMLLELRGEASVSAWARILRENHRAHDGKPPPRRLHDGELLEP
ncbi:MAG: hypothetical protein ACRDQ1_15615 [Sciscionella sp.]